MWIFQGNIWDVSATPLGIKTEWYIRLKILRMLPYIPNLIIQASDSLRILLKKKSRFTIYKSMCPSMLIQFPEHITFNPFHTLTFRGS
jgi:hypothetical protein